MRFKASAILGNILPAAACLALPGTAAAATVSNPLCAAETAIYAPGHGQDIVVPPGFEVSVFARGLNAPTGIAFLGSKERFQVFVLESGHGLPSKCNDQAKFGSGDFDPKNPFTSDVLVFNQFGKKIAGPLFKPTGSGKTQTGGLQAAGPAVDIAFENGLAGGRLFASDSNQSTDTPGGNINSSRIVVLELKTGKVKPFISNLPTGDHPSEQLAFKDGWVYWSQGSTTNNGVSDGEQPDIPCQPITLSKNLFVSSLGPPKVAGSGYSPFGMPQPGTTIPAFFNGSNHQIRTGVCDGATLRARLNNPKKIEAYGWGHRNGYAIRFAPEDHPLRGQLLVGEDGPDERGARPSNGAPEVLSVDYQIDGVPVFHGWPDRFGFLASSEAVFNPVGGPSDSLCVFDPANPPSFCTSASLANILMLDVPIADVLASPPAPIVAPIALEAADSSFTGIDFVPKSFVKGPVQPGAALYTLEGDFGFSAPNATSPAPEVGHEVKLINFNQDPALPLELKFRNFARNNTGDQAFISPTNPAAFDRPTNVRFGPDGCAYIVDYGAVRDPGGGPGGATRFVDPADAPLVQIPGTGTIFKICAAR